MLVLETSSRGGVSGINNRVAPPISTFSHNVDALYRNPPHRTNHVAHFASNLLRQQQPLAEGLQRAVRLTEAEVQRSAAEVTQPHPDQLPLETLARLSSSLSTVALGTRVFNQFYDNASHHTERAATSLEAAIAAHGTNASEFGYAYSDTLTELHLAKNNSAPSLLLDGDAYGEVIHASIEHCAAVLDKGIQYQPSHPDAIFLPFAVVAASAALPNNARLHAAATSAACMAKVIASAKFSNLQ